MLVAIARDDQTGTLLHICGREESHEKTRAYVMSSGDTDRTMYIIHEGMKNLGTQKMEWNIQKKVGKPCINVSKSRSRKNGLLL